MREILEKLVRRFYNDPLSLSRNRNFCAFLDPKVRQAARSGRLLRSLRSDLLERDIDSIQISRIETLSSTRCFELHLRWDGGWRTSYLSQLELDVLREDREVDYFSNLRYISCESARTNCLERVPQ